MENRPFKNPLKMKQVNRKDVRFIGEKINEYRREAKRAANYHYTITNNTPCEVERKVLKGETWLVVKDSEVNGGNTYTYELSSRRFVIVPYQDYRDNGYKVERVVKR